MDIEKIINKYGYKKEVNDLIASIMNNFKDSLDIEAKVAVLALNLCDEIENGSVTAKFSDDVFTLLSIVISDYFSEIILDKDIDNLIIEGMHLHDYGNKYSADLDEIRRLANNYLRKR